MPVQPSRVSAGRTSADERERDAEQSAGAARQQCCDAGAADVSSAALAFAASLTSRVDERVISHDSFTPPNLFRVEGEVPFARTVRDLNPRNHMVHPRSRRARSTGLRQPSSWPLTAAGRVSDTVIVCRRPHRTARTAVVDCVVAAGLEPAKPKHPGYSRAPLPLGYATENRVRVPHCKPNIVRLSIMRHHPVGAMSAENHE